MKMLETIEAEITTLSARGGLGGDWSQGTTRESFAQLEEAWTGLRIAIEEYLSVVDEQLRGEDIRVVEVAT